MNESDELLCVRQFGIFLLRGNYFRGSGKWMLCRSIAMEITVRFLYVLTSNINCNLSNAGT